MAFTHRSLAKVCQYLLIAMLSSGTVQLIHMWPALVWCLYALMVMGLLILIMIGVQYYGLFSGKRWAAQFDINKLNQGLLLFALVLLFSVIGGVPTWLAYLT